MLAGVFRGSPVLMLGLSETDHDINLIAGKLHAVSGSFTFDYL
jgi:hypothetical protein